MVRLFRYFSKIRGGSSLWSDGSQASTIINSEFFEAPVTVEPAVGALVISGFEPTISTGGGGGSPFTFVDSTYFDGDVNGGTTAGIDTTGATIIVISAHYYYAVPPTISDNKSNTWTALTEYRDSLPDNATRLYYCINPTVGSGHTFTTAGSGTYSGIRVVAFSSATTPIFDDETGSNAFGLTIQPGSITPANANNLFVAAGSFYSAASPVSVDSGFTVDSYVDFSANSYGAVIGYKVNSGSGSENPTFTGTGSSFYSSGAIANFYVTGGGGGGTTVLPGTGVLSVDGFSPTISVSNNINLSAGLGQLTINGFAPTINVTQSAITQTGVLTINGFAPTINVSNNQVVLPGTGILTLDGFAPTLSNSVTVSSGVGQLLLTGLEPTVNITRSALPGVGVLTISGFAPTIIVSNNKTVAPGVGVLTITGNSHTVNISQSALPGTGVLTVSGFAPTVFASDNKNVSPQVGSLTISGYSPSIIVSDNTYISTQTGALVINGFEPSILIVSNTFIYPGTGALLFEGKAPRIRVTNIPPTVIEPDSGSNTNTIIKANPIDQSVMNGNNPSNGTIIKADVINNSTIQTDSGGNQSVIDI